MSKDVYSLLADEFGQKNESIQEELLTYAQMNLPPEMFEAMMETIKRVIDPERIHQHTVEIFKSIFNEEEALLILEMTKQPGWKVYQAKTSLVAAYSFKMMQSVNEEILKEVLRGIEG